MWGAALSHWHQPTQPSRQSLKPPLANRVVLALRTMALANLTWRGLCVRYSCRCIMQKRRVALLEPSLAQLNRSAFEELVKEMSFECGQV